MAAARRRGDLTIFHEAPDDDDERAIGDTKHSFYDETLCRKALGGLRVFEDDGSSSVFDDSEPSCSSSSDSRSLRSTSAPVCCDKLKPPRPAYTCPLCLDIPIKCTSTKCGHAFCTS